MEPAVRKLSAVKAAGPDGTTAEAVKRLSGEQWDLLLELVNVTWGEDSHV